MNLSSFSIGRICSREAKRKTNLGNVTGQRKNSPRKSWISSYFLLFARTNSPGGKWALSEAYPVRGRDEKPP